MFNTVPVEIMDVLFRLKESIYQHKNIKKILNYYLKNSDVYIKNILSKLNVSQHREKVLADIQQLLKEAEDTPKKIALQLQSVLPSNSCLLLSNPSQLLVKIVESLERSVIYLPLHSSAKLKTQLSNHHTVIITTDFESVSVDAVLLSCNFSEQGIILDEKEYLKMKKQNILFVATTNHQLHNTKGAVSCGKIVTEKGVFSHSALIEELNKS